MAITCTAVMKIPMPGKYCSPKGECRKPMPKAGWGSLFCDRVAPESAGDNKSQRSLLRLAQNPNHWRAITSLNALVRVTHQRRRGTRSHCNIILADSDYDPIRRACLAFACWGVHCLLCDDVGIISALADGNQHQLAAPTMDRDDVLFWLSLFWFVALCGLAIWMLLSA